MMQKDDILKIINEQKNSIGYFDLPYKQDELLLKIDEFKHRYSHIENIYVIGTGGSSLGIKAIHKALRISKRITKNIFFLENLDPIENSLILNNLNIEKSLFFIISKSGTTIETISIYKTLLANEKIAKLKQELFVVITDVDSNLDKHAKVQGYKTFHIYPNVGGRFSVLSSVGLVPLSLAGYDIKMLLEGAKKCSNAFFELDLCDDMIKKSSNFIDKNSPLDTNVVFAYSNAFYEFNKWYVQLWGESLGKVDNFGNNIGFTPIGLIGSVDQHSFLQLLMDGPKNKSVTFIKVKNFDQDVVVPDITLEFLEAKNFVNKLNYSFILNSQCDSTKEALDKVGVKTDLIEIDSLNEENMGWLIFYYQLLTSVMATILNIDAYNQPGVEIGKKILKSKLY